MGEILTTLAEQGQVFAVLMKVLQEIDEQSTLAKLNETTISDNNGGRIML